MTGLPIKKQMTDLGDGTYTVDYTVPSCGTFIVSVELSGLKAEYFTNHNWSGTPAITRIDPNIWFNFGSSFPTVPIVNSVSARWSGKLFAPYSEDFTFWLFGDDGA